MPSYVRPKQAPRLHVGTPIWLDQPGVRRTRFPRLHRRISTDVVIVGGGITGAIAAWRFVQAGVGVVVLESARIGGGSTAASTSLLMQEPDTDYAELSHRYGDPRTRRIWELSRYATKAFVTAVATLEIECDLTYRDSVYYARSADHLRRLRQEHRRRSAAGVRSRWLDAAALRRATGIHAAGAIRTKGNAQADPYRACLGFARAAREAGAAIYERSDVRSIHASKHGVRVRTAHGTVDAGRIIVATGYATPSFEPLQARFRMLQTYVLATRRLSAHQRRAFGLGPVMIWDTGRPYYYARWTPDGRILFGGGDRPRVHGTKRKRAVQAGLEDVRAFFAERYPAIDDVRFEYAWEGLFATTPDGLPYIGPHRRYPRHLFALGYGGNGMTFGYLASELLVDLFFERANADAELFAFGRMRR